MRREEESPTARDVLLLVEVADTSLKYDRETKATLYARAGIVEMWLVDLTHGVVEVYRNPSAEGYRSVERLERGQELPPLSFPSTVIRVEEIVG